MFPTIWSPMIPMCWIGRYRILLGKNCGAADHTLCCHMYACFAVVKNIGRDCGKGCAVPPVCWLNRPCSVAGVPGGGHLPARPDRPRPAQHHHRPRPQLPHPRHSSSPPSVPFLFFLGRIDPSPQSAVPGGTHPQKRFSQPASQPASDLFALGWTLDPHGGHGCVHLRLSHG